MTEQQTGQESGEATETTTGEPASSQTAAVESQPSSQREGQQSDESSSERGQGQAELGQQTFDRSYVTELRNENATYRTRANQAETERGNFEQQFNDLRQGLARALGVGDDEKEPDVGQIQSQLQETQSQFRRERLQNVVLRRSLQNNADPELTWAHLYASGALDSLDVNSSELSGDVTTQIQAALEAVPKLAVNYSPAPPNVGGGSNPSTDDQDTLGERNPWTQEHWNLTEQAQILTKDRNLGERLQKAAKAT